MALPPGGPQGDYVSQTQYAAQQVKERQSAPQQPQPSQAAERQEERSVPDQKSPKPSLEEKIAAENDRNAVKNNASKVEHLGITPLTEKAQAAIDAKAQQMAAEQKQGQGQGLGRGQGQEQEQGR